MNPAHKSNIDGDQERLQRIYDKDKAKEYRSVLDEMYGKTFHSSIISQIIKGICIPGKSDGLDVLDLGCGTGRYFKAIGNVRSLTGIDISVHMIDEARARISSDNDICQRTTLQCANIGSCDIPKENFDLILSIGTLGEYCPLSNELIDKAMSGLKPGGIFLFTVFDAGHKSGTRVRSSLSKARYVRLSNKIYPLMPGRFKRPFARWFFSYYLTMEDLNHLLSGSTASTTLVRRLSCPKEEWDGTHLVVLMCRSPHKDTDLSALLDKAWEGAARNANIDRANIL